VHQELRERLASVRRDLADGAAVPEDLLAYCLGFCAAVHAHHNGEDERLLPRLRDAAPELAPVIDKLIEDHALVSSILRRIRELLAPDQDTEPATLARELDGLTAILESHFGYEERSLGPALDELDPATSIPDVLTRPAALGG
jgi:iron-sulfur cluster repair protein YtfE (RIC family)